MTREEEILNDPNLSCYVDKKRGWINEAFLDGVLWADNTMLEKVATWLWENFYDNPHVNGIVSSDAFNNVDDMTDDFFKAMKG